MNVTGRLMVLGRGGRDSIEGRGVSSAVDLSSFSESFELTGFRTRGGRNKVDHDEGH